MMSSVFSVWNTLTPQRSRQPFSMTLTGALRGNGSAATRELAAQAGFDRVRHHLLERRIGDQEVVDLAGNGGIGAAEFERRRRAVGFGIASIGGDVRRDPVGQADHRIEALKIVLAREQRIDSGLVLQIDLGVVEAPAGGEGELLGDIERIGRVDADIGVVGGDVRRCETGVGLVDEYAGAGHEEVLVDGAEFRCRLEAGLPTIDAGADHEMVVMSKYLVGARRLQRAAVAVRARPVAIDLADRRIGGKRIEDGHVPVERCGVVTDAELSGKRSAVVAGLRIRAVAIDMERAVGAEIGVGLERERVGRRPFPVRLQEGELKMGRLRPGEDARPALVQHLDRSRSGGAKLVVRAGE
jgi:hypothetical protein